MVTDELTETPILFLSPLPLFVVTSNTPFPALDPYNAAALGPFSTETLSISVELISDNTLALFPVGSPSITISGASSPDRDIAPRIITWGSLLISGLRFPTFRPATFPVSAFTAFSCGTLLSWSLLTSPTEYPSALCDLVMPSAVTTIASPTWATSCSNTTLKSV